MEIAGRGLDPSRALDSAAELHGAVKTAPYKAPVNGDPRKKQQKKYL